MTGIAADGNRSGHMRLQMSALRQERPFAAVLLLHSRYRLQTAAGLPDFFAGGVIQHDSYVA